MFKTKKSRLKVLLVGQNYASVMNSLLLGLEQTNGIDAKAYAFDTEYSPYNIYSKFKYQSIPFENGKWRFAFHSFLGLLDFIKNLLRCDLVHIFHLSSNYPPLERIIFFLINLSGKKKVVTFMGSEVRVPEVASKLNLYYNYAYNNLKYEYKYESKELSFNTQKKYSEKGFSLIIWDVGSYIDKALFSSWFTIPHASINLYISKKSITPIEHKSILIIHGPTAPVAKGTEMIVKAVEPLLKKFTNIEFKLLKDLSNKEYVELCQKADIIIDQLVWGGYGITTQQNLELGKIVLCYLNAERVKLYGEDCPVVNVNKNTLTIELEDLINNSDRRIDLGQRGKEYYAKMHHPISVASKMKQAYTSIIYGNQA